ncbi:protein-disulfide isomerase [Altererythrobacter sp. B11]|uniref:thioredoxin domain-containing protein n=1 Tax=Altererythrobacter sp. B11 TaxID=2060312 RepID=UPI000DC6D782|nr:thioredoxin domain-containing protein [Altererythrobacter sp. B11]BBC72309.1 protein-disulfide isomerase [Altererythrobacter sp. B11]
MTRLTFPRLLIAGLVAPLALGLAACGSSDETAEGAPPKSEPIAAIPAPQGTSWTEVAAVTPEGGYREGKPDAPIKLVEYASHTCPHCSDFAAESAEGLEKMVASGVVSYELRNQIHDPLDLTIALLARCNGPEAFHPLTRQAWSSLQEIYGTAQSNAQAMQSAMQAQDDSRFQRMAEAAGLIDFFAARGISREKAQQCLANTQEAREIVERSNTQSDELAVTGTPTFFINGKRIEGTTWEILEPALQQAGAR